MVVPPLWRPILLKVYRLTAFEKQFVLYFKDAARVERSVAVALMAYLVLLRLQAKQVKPGASWSAFTLKQNFAWEVGAQQIKRITRQKTLKEIRKLRLAA